MPEELSAADTYRVLLGRALMRRPGILLLDRTIAEADPDVQELMRKEFANINRELGITVIYATDNQKTAVALGTRTIVMNEGETARKTPRRISMIIRRACLWRDSSEHREWIFPLPRCWRRTEILF